MSNTSTVKAFFQSLRAEAGKVLFVRDGPADDYWIEDWIDEMCAFPYGEHDDRVDAVSGVFAMLSAAMVCVVAGAALISSPAPMAGWDAGSAGELSAALNESDLRNSAKADFWPATSWSSPVILMNQVTPSRRRMAPNIRTFSPLAEFVPPWS